MGRTEWCASRFAAVFVAPASVSEPSWRVFRGRMPRLCYDYGMARTRISTTVDADLLKSARQVRAGVTDAALIDEALAALLARRRAAEFDAAYAAYAEHPLDEADEWGDLASFRADAGAS